MARPPDSKLARLLQELKIIPWWSYAAAVFIVALLGWFFGGWYLNKLKQVWGEGSHMVTYVPFLAVVVLWIWLVMIFYVTRDAQRRQMSVPLWTLLVIIIPNALGFIIYLLLREPIPLACPKCSASLRPDFAFCPACGHGRAPTCPSCHHPIETEWVSCAYCGIRLGD